MNTYGVKTTSAVLNELYALADKSKITSKSKIVRSDGVILHIGYNNASTIEYTGFYGNNTTLYFQLLLLQQSGSINSQCTLKANFVDVQDLSAFTIQMTYKLYY